MKILTNTGFRKFEGFQIRRGVSCIEIRCREVYGDGEKRLVGSADHRVIAYAENGEKEWVRLDSLRSGQRIDTELGIYVIEAVESAGDRDVWTPVNVEGGEYDSEGFRNHNCSFAGSTSTLIGEEGLDRLHVEDPVEYKYGYDMNVYELPDDRSMYVMGVDSAMGNTGDYSAIQVLKVKKRGRYQEVAAYRRNTIRPEDFAEVVHSVSEWYNNALYIIENNDVGRIVADRLYYEIGDGNMISTDRRGNLGTRADRGTKLEACQMLKHAIEKGELKVIDSETIAELSRFEEVSPNVFRAATGKHDDLVSALYWAVYCLNQPEIDLDSMKVVDTDTGNDTLPPPIYMDLGGVNPFGEGIDAESFWKGLN